MEKMPSIATTTGNLKRFLFFSFVYIYQSSVFAYTFDIDNQGLVEIELHSDIQFDQYNFQNCPSINCGSEDDGLRIADFDGTLKQYTGPHSLIFLDVGLGYRSGSTIIADPLKSDSTNTFDLDRDDNDIDEVIFGLSYRQHEITIGKHQLKTNSFGPSAINYLSFRLSGFKDDRLNWFNYQLEKSIYVSSSGRFNTYFGNIHADSLDINAVVGGGIGNFGNSRLYLNYDFLFETTIPGTDNLVLSLAARSLGRPNSRKDLDSFGIKLNIFDSRGAELTAGYTENDFGSYIEFALEAIWDYRNKITIGSSNFNVDSDVASRSNSIPITDAYFLFFGYTRAISELLHLFVEMSKFDNDDGKIENALIGLKMSF